MPLVRTVDCQRCMRVCVVRRAIEGAARAVRAVHGVRQGMCVWLHP